MATKNLGRVTGKSAYEVWLEQGNTGSEQDFLNSLKADVKVPTKLSELDNDKGFTTTDDLNNYVEENKEELKGENGVGISSVTQTTTSTADDGENVITVTKTDGSSATFKVKNGSKGSKGDPGKTPEKGTDYWTEEDKTEIKEYVADVVPTKTSELENDSKYIQNADLEKLTLGINPADGLVYIYIDGKAIGSGIEMGATGESIGYVDVATNTIVINTSLGEGTYVVQYEMEDGDPIYIGELEIDNSVRYTVTNNLTKCSTNNLAEQVIGGESYTAIISPDTGHIVDDITVIMGGNDITSTAVEGNTISIESVDGAIEITAIAVEQTVTDNYTITNNLTNCTNSNNTAEIVSGNPYTATISTTPAYALSSLKVLMAGVDVSSNVITKTATGATISIASVTGNVVITASAVENLIAQALDFTYANSTWTLSSNVLKDTSVTPNTIGYKTGYNTSSSTGVDSATSGSEITGFIPVKYGDTIRIKNIATTENNRINVQCYKGTTTDGVTTLTFIAATTLYSGFITRGTDEGNGVRSMVLTGTHNNKFTASAGITHMKFSSTDINNNSVITVNKEII